MAILSYVQSAYELFFELVLRTECRLCRKTIFRELQKGKPQEKYGLAVLKEFHILSVFFKIVCIVSFETFTYGLTPQCCYLSLKTMDLGEIRLLPKTSSFQLFQHNS